jgi:hypothetical protein
LIASRPARRAALATRTSAVAAIALVVASMLSTAPALAQPDDATRLAAHTLGEAGLTLFERGDYRGALEKFDRALALVQVPTLAVRAARCLAKLGRLVEASERYRVTGAMVIDASAPPAFQKAQAEAKEQANVERAALMARLPSVKILLDGAGPADVTLEIDGKATPTALLGLKVPVDPGAHHVVAHRAADAASGDVTVREGESSSLLLHFTGARPPVAVATDAAAPAERPRSALRTAGVVVFGVGAAAIVVGGVTYFVALGKTHDLDAACPDDTCHADAKDQLATYDGLRTASTISLIAGGVVAAGGAILFFTAPSGGPRPAASLSPWIGPGSGGVRGSF